MGFSFLFRIPDSIKMTRGPKKHMKRLAAPKSWMLDKLGGVYSVRPNSGPHRLRESMPLAIFLRNRLKYALTAKEVETILRQRLIKIDGKVRTDPKFPAGFMDVVQIDKTGENFRLIYDVKGRYTIHRITNQEAKYKLCRVREIKTGPKNVPYLYTSDGRTIRYPDPIVKANDSIRLDIVHVKDAQGHTFATRMGYIFVIGKGNKPYISLPKGNGIKLTVAEERDKRMARA